MKIPFNNANTHNYAINGTFDFWQRGFSFQSVANNTSVYSPDRFFVIKNGAMTPIFSRQTLVPTVAQSGYKSNYSARVQSVATTTPGSAEYCNLVHRIEGYNAAKLLASKYMTVSFWVRGTLTGTYSLSLVNGVADRSYVSTYTINAANTWEKKSIVFDLRLADASGTWNYTNGVGLQVVWDLGSGTDFQTSTLNAWQSANKRSVSTQVNLNGTTSSEFYLAQVSFTEGASTGPFQRHGETYEKEMISCLRYYEKSFDLDLAPLQQGYGGYTMLCSHWQGVSSTDFIYYKVRKRVVSSQIAFYAPSGAIGGGSVPSGQWNFYRTSDGGQANVTPTVEVQAEDFLRVRGTPSLGNGVQILAAGHWTADAEL